MKQITTDEIRKLLKQRQKPELFCVGEIELCDADLSGWDLSCVDFSLSTFRNVCFDGANLSYSSLENGWFQLYCPETGPFLGYKKCFGNWLVQLLIPADAKRTSATRPSCRCS